MTAPNYLDQLRAAGHVLQLDEDGNVDLFALSYEFHNGPRCVNCGDDWCHHCRDKIKPCPGAQP